MQKIWGSMKQHWEEVGTLFLLVFIPLYPKLPLFDIVQTWVYIRLDDFVVALVVLGFLAKLYRRKYIPDTPLTIPIVLYWVIGLLSVSWSLAFIGPKLLNYFPQLVFLHYLRRIEYMIMFFLAVTGMRSLKYIRKFLIVFAITVGIVSLYGLGQRYMRFPAFLTMNEEFAKGTPLYLSPTSRITSLFAGHYDLAMYLAFATTIFASIFFAARNGITKLSILVLSGLATLVLFLTQSRISLFALGAGLFFVLWWQNKKRWFLPLLIFAIIAIPFIPGLSDRFAKTFRDKPVICDIRAGIPIGAAHIGDDGEVTVEKSASPAIENLPIGSGFIRVPGSVRVPLIASFAVGELRKSPGYPFGAQKPSLGEELQMAMERNQMYLSLHRPLVVEKGEVASVSGRFFLDRALLYDISATTRFQGQWPRAWEAFRRNVLLGSGFSVLSLAADSDYMRALGETGLLGFLSFFFILVVFFLYSRKAIHQASPLVQALTIGVASATIGLLLTATLLDVFEASKLAYVYWLTVGTTVAGLGITYKRKFLLFEETKKILSHPFVFILFIAILTPIVYANVSSMYFIADDFTWLRWASNTKLTDFYSLFTNATGFFYRPLTKLYFFFASLIFWFKPEGYHNVNLFLHVGSTILTYLIIRRLTSATRAVAASVIFAIAAIHHENVVWISGVSSLAGSFFALLSLYLWIIHKKIFSLISLMVSMLFYEEMLFVPLILVAYSWIFETKKSRVLSFLTLVFIPLYWWLRSHAQALPPSGSYGINVRALPFNVFGNAFGYTVLTIFGPITFSLYDWTRAILRTNPMIATTLFLLALFAFLRFVRTIRLSKPVHFFVVFTFATLLPVLGLGNIAERYGYLASAPMSFLFVSFVRKMYDRKKVLAILLFMFVLGTNYWQLKKILKQWEQAGKISERIVYEMRRMYYPIEPNTRFVVAHVPTRIGRAWVFPVGLEDAVYHVFYDPTMKLDVVGMAEDALSVKGAKALMIVDDKENPVRKLYE